MQKRFLRALICTTTVLAIIGLTMMVRHISGNTYTNDIGSVEVETAKETETEQMSENAMESEVLEDTVFSAEATGQGQRPIIQHKPKRSELLEDSDADTTTGETLQEQVSEETTTEEQIQELEELYSANEFKTQGVIWWDGWKWTWYSEKVLSGGGLDIPGRHNDDNGYVCDENDYICLSSSVLSKGTVIDTPFGKQGRVYDTGCPSNVIDVYVGW